MGNNALDNSPLLRAIDTLHSAGSTWAKDPAGRASMTLACHDADYLPRVKDAGQTKTIKGTSVQVMHNGLYVKQDGYQGEWQAKIIRGLKGVHEPQEEKVFYEVLKRVKPGGVMMELGAWWCYYSMWFLKAVKESKVICCEPDPENLELGKFNMGLNNFTVGEEAVFYEAAAGAKDKEKISFTTESGTPIRTVIRTVDSIVREQSVSSLQVLHIDIQGAELKALHGALKSIQAGAVRFVFISTHHYSISGDPAIHNKCLEFIKDNGGTIVAQHTVLESCSGDGLIVASFKREDKDFQVEISAQHVNDSLFRSSEEDVDILWREHDKLIGRVLKLTDKERESEVQLNNLGQELKAKDQNIAQLQTALNEITPLRRHVKHQIKHRLIKIDKKILSKLERQNSFEAAPVANRYPSSPTRHLTLAKDSDLANFGTYNAAPRQHPALPLYQATRKAAKTSISMLRKKPKKAN